ncbi:DUF3857 domain-containing protein [uncultured Mucilaginibacter sp.]|uniref:DUF3857 domain-containing protein n=1 Tax=uncultured Mucilaginibacter sp. TaxID=797541 RepID=UPI0025DC3639|nr:DUF3857 domain-containing protein [uncultured Mucilaginibacter sp.]
MIKYILITGILLTGFAGAAQNKYEASTIPKELLPYASAVIRNMEITSEVKDLNTSIYKHHEVVTVLNKNGDTNAGIEIWYDKNRRIKNIKGTVYDEFGKAVSQFSERNFNDYSSYDGFSMFTDNRIKYYKPAVVNYPYTIDYEFEISSKQSLNVGDWKPITEVGTAIEKSTYTFICKPDFIIRYKQLNYAGAPKESITEKGLKTYTWEVANVKAIRSEPFGPHPEMYQPIVKVVPQKFNYLGYEGSFTNWNELGKWVYDKLLAGRATLPPATVQNIKSLTDTIKDQKLKAKAIYEYMQRKSRYVSIQVGIGGLQPFTAADVDALSYGDCKGLVNYTQALLAAADIPSYYCIVEAGDLKRDLMPDFASVAQGNHIILCLPFKNDTTWLECTRQDSPFGYLGDFTDDRRVLACTAEGGKLMRTPKYSAQESTQIRKAVLELKPDGELAGSMTTIFDGWKFDNRPVNPGDINEEIKNTKKNYGINNLEIENLQLKAVKNLKPVNNETIKFSARDYASQAGNTYYFMANLANRRTNVPREVKNRTTNVYINRGYTDIDEITYNVPEGFKLDSKPLLVNLKKPFGTFTATAVKVGNQVVYKRKLEVLDGVYPKEQYQELVDFFQAIADADNYKVALVKN